MTTAAPEYLLHLADNALVLGQRNAEWCGHGPVLEEDIAMANIGLDLIGQARMLYQHAARLLAPTLAAPRASLPPDGAFAPWGGPAALNAGHPSEDSLAYWRDAPQFRNWVLVELPHRTAFAPSVATGRDYAVTIARNFLVSSLMHLYWDALQASADPQLAAIAARSVKEVRYHLRHSTDWLIRLGDGTDESHARMQAALDYLLPYTQEFWAPSELEAQALANGVGIDLAALRAPWDAALDTVLAEATLKRPPANGRGPRGKQGLHSEHLSYLLAEMQSLARAHPGAVW